MNRLLSQREVKNCVAIIFKAKNVGKYRLSEQIINKDKKIADYINEIVKIVNDRKYTFSQR